METLSFKTQKDFRKWLAKNHDEIDGIWLKIYKKDSRIQTVTYAEALDEALCYGWIDGLKKSLDKDSWIQKFTPRRRRSPWSKINTEHVERLIKEKKMTTVGLKQIDAAKADGRWAAAYERFASAEVPEEFMKALEKNKKAKALFETLNKTDRFAIAYRLHSAKREETRQKRIKDFLERLARGEKFH
jgi:uncharacterized protein YdeI (YjbR/CyaY-like superfamily)